MLNIGLQFFAHNAFSIIYAIPSIILYVLSQKYMSKGFAMEGGAKG